jgi:predicted metal-dependent hydrolase
MSQKIIELPGIGPVILAKRRGSKNIRLTVLPDGRVRVSMPTWVPYSAGINFAAARTEWIKRYSAKTATTLLRDGQRIGKSYRMKFITAPAHKTTQSRLGINSITITSPLPPHHADVQTKAKAAAERALKKEAHSLLGARLRELAAKNSFNYRDFKVKRLSSRWGSCSSNGDITLNFFLIQLPWRLIDYVIIHELVHTIHHNHSRQFWDEVEKILPEAKSLRREIKIFRPIILTD